MTMKRTHLIAGIFVAIFALMLSVNEAVAQSTSVSMSNKQGVSQYTSKSGSQKLDVEYDGKIVFSEDDKSIKSISRGGYMLIKKTSFGQRKRNLS